MANDADAAARRVLALARRIPDQFGRALYQEAKIERTESMRRTPVDTNALRLSHKVHSPVFHGQDITVTITAGGPAVTYAREVHRRP